MEASNFFFCAESTKTVNSVGFTLQSDADLAETLFHEGSCLDAGFDLISEEREFEGNAATVDLFIANAIVVGVDPAGFIEQVFGFVQILMIRLGAAFWKYTTNRRDSCLCIGHTGRSTSH